MHLILSKFSWRSNSILVFFSFSLGTVLCNISKMATSLFQFLAYFTVSNEHCIYQLVTINIVAFGEKGLDSIESDLSQ